MTATISAIPQGHDIKPIFARHETFHPRYGWFKKGYDKAKEDEKVFSREDAPVVLGVGKNMVSAIRYWSLGFKILDENKDKAKKSSFKPSDFGSRLLDEHGWDPYLENPASLWLLHWSLFKPPCYAPAWHFAFNEFNQVAFTAEDLFLSLKEYRNRVFPSAKISDSSLNKDINCLFRMYVERNSSKSLREDTIDCPFTALGLIAAYSDSKRFAFNFGVKPTLAKEVVVSACLDFSSATENGAKTISVSRLLYEPGSPGRIFKLTESALCEIIEQVSRDFKQIALTETAGLLQFSYQENPKLLAEELLTLYYGKRG